MEERTIGRFEKVLRFYWDGLPTPPFVENDKAPRGTFVLRLLGYSPDYYGETIDIDATTTGTHTHTFRCLAEWGNTTTSISSRIGSHYSPLVGVFSFGNVPSFLPEERKFIRIPFEACEVAGKVAADEDEAELRMDIRLERLVTLYEPLVKEQTPISREMLRNIVVSATEGLQLSSKEWVIKQIGDVTMEYNMALGAGIYYYMSMDPLYRLLLKPLQLRTAPTRRKAKIFSVALKERSAARREFLTAKQSIENSLIWAKDTREYFSAIKFVWDSRFKRMIIFNLSATEWATDLSGFVKQISDSKRAAVTRIRIEFYSKVEELFFSLIPRAKDVLLMTAKEVEASRFHRIFKATRFFFFTALRELLFENLEKLILFFDCCGRKGKRITKTVARKHPVLYTEITIGDNNLPQTPDLARFFFKMSEMLDELADGVNKLPGITSSILRTLDIKSEAMNVMTEVELVYFRSVLFDIFDQVMSGVDSLRAAYTLFTVPPAKNAQIAEYGDSDKLKQHITELQKSVTQIQRSSEDIVFFGCFAVDCRKMKAELSAVWSKLLELFYADIDSCVRSVTVACNKKCEELKEQLEVTPSTVKDLEKYLECSIEAKKLSESLRENECKQVMARVACMEECQVAIATDLYAACVQLMKWPNILDDAVHHVEITKRDCGPQLEVKLKEKREEVRLYVKTLSTGITELYNMLNLEICDIAAQTCYELRELVDNLLSMISDILHQEAALGVKETDNFDDVYLLVNYFDTIEQFWVTINRATAVQVYYSTSINKLNAEEMIENVREWRRLLHCATRNLRAFAPLVTLGRQQEVILANFEALEPLLHAITSPGLRKSHWKEICRFLTPKAHDDIFQILNGVATLRSILDAGIEKCTESLYRITEQARCDHAAETELEAMKSKAKKTHFLLEVTKKPCGASFTKITKECKNTVICQLEHCLRSCQKMQRELVMSSMTLSSVTEWESVTERARNNIQDLVDTLEQWETLFCYYQAFTSLQELTPQQAGIYEKLGRASEAFTVMFNTVSRAQFSLFMAIVQETIADQTLLAKTAMKDACVLVEATMDAKRAVYPRFNFVSNKQLLTFLSPFNIEQLNDLLPFMFTQLTSLEVVGNMVVGFTTGDGASIQAVRPIHLRSMETEYWMLEFETTLRESVIAAIKKSVSDCVTTDLENWLSQTPCAQSCVMALRVTHTKSVREALRLSLGEGLRACKNRAEGMLEEFYRILRLNDLEYGNQIVASSAILYCQHMCTELEHAMKSSISTTTELDSTAMLQTFMMEDRIITRLLGSDFEYGCEFLGNYFTPVMTAELLDKALCTQLFSSVGHLSPILCGGDARTRLLDFVSSAFGRFTVRVQCGKWLSLEALAPIIRGAIMCGAMLCFQDCEDLPTALREFVINSVEEAKKQVIANSESAVVSLPLGHESSFVNIPVHQGFSVIFTAQSYSNVPPQFSIKYRPMHLPDVDLAAMVRSFMYAYALDNSSESGLCSDRFAAFFQYFSAAEPTIFTPASMVSVLRHATLIQSVDTPAEKLCESFSRVFFSTIRGNERLKELLEWNVRHTMRISTSSVFYDRLMMSFKFSARDVYSRFADMMISHHNVIITGPSFTGKTRLWRKWAGNSKFTVFAPSLVSSEDMYGSAKHPGLLSAISKNCPRGSTNYLVLEDYDVPNRLPTDWPYRSRIVMDHGDFLFHEDTRIIASVNSVKNMNPHQLGSFGVFAMHTTIDWKGFLKSRLRGAPKADIACRMMEACVPFIRKAVYATGGRDSDDADEEILTTCQKSCQLYRNWHRYCKQVVQTDDNFLPLSDDAYAAQCAIMAVFWSEGGAVSLDQRHVLIDALRKLRVRIAAIVDELDIREDLLPVPLSDDQDVDIMNYVATPLGWKTFEEVTRHGFSFSWAGSTYLNPQAPAWFQIYPAPSRVRTMQMLECLVLCGQSVLLSGGSVSGKSSVLRSFCHSTSLCIPYMVSANMGFSPTTAQEGIAARISKRSSGAFGPMMGKKLVVCIDDVHLSHRIADDYPVAARLITYCDKYNAIITPKTGFVPTVDTQFLGTMAEDEKLAATVWGFCVNVRLPDLDGAEMLKGMWTFFEAVCAKRRIEELPRKCAAFVSQAHSAFTNIVSPINSPVEQKEGLANATTTQVKSSLERDVNDSLTVRFLESLRASEVVRLNMLLPVTDVQVVAKTVGGVSQIYLSTLANEAPDAIPDFQKAVVAAAEKTLRPCVPEAGLPFKSLVDENQTALLSNHVLPEEWSSVANWITEFEASIDDVKEDVLENMFVTPPPVRDSESIEYSVLIRYPTAQQSQGGRMNSTRITKGSAGSVLSSSLSGSYRPFQSKRTSRVISHHAPLSDEAPPPREPQHITQTFQTTWLTRGVSLLHHYITSGDGSFSLVGSSDFGLSRVLRLACFATKTPFALLWNRGSEYTIETFKNEMRSVIQFACTNKTKVVVFVHQDVLSVSNVISYVDYLLRTGDVSGMFSVEQIPALFKGYVLSRYQSLTRLTTQEESEFRAHIRRLLRFMIHVETNENLNILSKAYPSIARLTSFSITMTKEDLAQLKREIVSSVLYDDVNADDDLLRDKIKECNGDLLLMQDDLVDVICEIFNTVQSISPTKLEQLISFARMVKYMRKKNLLELHQASWRVSVLSKRGDEATAAVSSEGRILRQATSEVLAVKSKSMSLLMKTKVEEKQLAANAQAAEKANAKVSERTYQLSEKKRAVIEKQRDIDEDMERAATKLRKVKPQAVEALAASRPPDKGVVLLKGIFKIMEQDLPKVGASELWYGSVKEIGTKGFAARLSRLSPRDVTDMGELMGVAAEVGALNFSKSLPYAQLLADFVVTYIETARYRIQVTEKKLAEIAAEEKELAEEKEKATALQEKVAESKRKIETIAGDDAKYNQQLEDLFTVQRVHGERQKLLTHYVSLVDSINRFIASDRVTKTALQGKNAEGDTILLAAYLSLSGMHSEVERLNRAIVDIMRKRKIPFSVISATSFFPLLYPDHEHRVDHFVSPMLTDAQRMSLAVLRQRVGCRWMVLGGVQDYYSTALETTLRQICTGCMVMSAFDPDFVEQLKSALKEGEGVILRDVFNKENFNKIRPLLPLYDLLWEASRERSSSQWQKRSSSENKDAEIVKRIPFTLLGEQVEVHPKFFLVCTSDSPLMLANFPICRHMDVINFYSLAPTKLRFDHLLLRAPLSSGVSEQLSAKENELHGSVHSFMRNHTNASIILMRDIEHFATNGAKDLAEADFFMGEVDIADVEIAQYVSQMKALRRQHNILLADLEKPLRQIEEELRFIEEEKLGHSWDSRLIDLFIANMWTMPPEIASRISPRLFSEIPTAEKCFYALVNLIEQLVQCFACGWPDPLRGILSLLLFNSCVLASGNVIKSQEGVLFAKHLSFLNAAQCEALRCVLSGRNTFSKEAAELRIDENGVPLTDDITNFLTDVYLRSNDRLLSRVVHDYRGNFDFPVSWGDEDAEGEEEFDLKLLDFFLYILRREFKSVNTGAIFLVNVFFASVKDSKSLNMDLSLLSIIPEAKLTRADVERSAIDSSLRPGRMVKGQSTRPLSPTDGLDLFVPQFVHSRSLLLLRSTKLFVPTCTVTNYPEPAIKTEEQKSIQVRYEFMWYHICAVKDMFAVTKRVMGLFYKRPSSAAGYWVTLHLDPPVEHLANQPDEKTLFCYGLQVFLGLLGGRRIMEGSGKGKGIAVCVSLIFNPKTQQILWENAANRNRCFFSSHDFLTPVRHLRSLITNDAFLHRSLWNSSITTSIEKKKNKSGTKEEEGTDAVQSRALMQVSRLLAKEILVVHAGFSERQRLLTEEWRYRHSKNNQVGGGDAIVTRSGSIADNVLFGSRAGDDHVAILLLLLNGWVQQSMATLNRISSRQTRNSSALAQTILQQNRSLGAAEANAGLLAYYYYRDRKWYDLHAHSSFTTTDEELLFVGAEFLVGSDAYSATEKIELVESYLSMSVFSFFQKLSYQLLASGDQPASERRAIMWMVQHLLVSPSSTGVVNCNLTQCDVQSLVVDDNEDFGSLLDGTTSDLVELCGSTEAVYAHYDREGSRIQQLLLTLVASPSTRAAKKNIKRFVDIFRDPVERRSDDVRATFEGDDEYSSLYWRLERDHLRKLHDYYLRHPAVDGAGSIYTRVKTLVRTLLDSDTVDRGDEPLGVWIPLLHSPISTIALLSAARQERLRTEEQIESEQVNGVVLDDGTFPEILIVVTLRRLLQPQDVVLRGASFSIQLEDEIRLLTGWDTCKHSVEPMTEEDPEAVVIAARSIGVDSQKRPLGVSAGSYTLPSDMCYYSTGKIPFRFRNFPHPHDALEFLWKRPADANEQPPAPAIKRRRNPKARDSLTSHEEEEVFVTEVPGTAALSLHHVISCVPVPLVWESFSLETERGNAAAPLRGTAQDFMRAVMGKSISRGETVPCHRWCAERSMYVCVLWEDSQPPPHDHLFPSNGILGCYMLVESPRAPLQPALPATEGSLSK